MDASKTMSDKVQYEEVPQNELNDYQKFHTNVAKNQDVQPWQGGVAAEVLGVPAIAGAKTVQGVLKSKGLDLAKNLIEDKLEALAAAKKPPVPTTVSEFHTPQMVSEYGFGPGAMKNVAHNIDMARVNELHSDLVANPEKGFTFEGNRRILTPEAKPWEIPTTAAAPSAPAALTPTQRAMQVVKGAAQNPMVRSVAKGAGTLGGLWEGGENLVRLWNHFKHDQPAREMLDVAGLLSNTATLAPTPFSPWSNIAGAGLSIPIGMYQRHLEKQDETQNKAVGGLATLR